jgi:hypothetical protein
VSLNSSSSLYAKQAVTSCSYPDAPSRQLICLPMQPFVIADFQLDWRNSSLTVAYTPNAPISFVSNVACHDFGVAN